GGDGKAEAVHRRHAAVADLEPLDLDHRRGRSTLAHRGCSPRETMLESDFTAANSTATAMKTVTVCNSAMAADSSELELSQELMIEGAITFALGPMRNSETPSSRTPAMKIKSQAAAIPGRSRGKVTLRIWCSQVAPQTRAHSSRPRSTCSTTPARVRTPSGINTVK